jgi:hypothetical protein
VFKRSKQDLRIIKWSTEAPKSTEGEKSQTWVKCLARKKIKYQDPYDHTQFYEKLRVSLNVSRQKAHEKRFVPVFRFEIMRILMAADLVLQIGWVPTFFSVKVPHIITVSYS